MARQLPMEEEKNSEVAFFFLFLYTASVLIRPHEMFQMSIEWVLVKVFAILALISVLFAHRPLKLYPQHWMALGLVPFIAVSGFLNTSGTDGIDYSLKLFISSIIPLFLYSTCITSIKKQHALMILCIISALLMVHNGHVQQTSHLHLGWALDTQGMFDRGTDVRRITYLGFFGDPNDLGMFLVMTIPFVLYFYTQGKFLTKLIMTTILIIFGYGIYLTASRGTMLGAGALVGIYFLVMNAGPRLFIFSIILAPIAATVIASLQSSIDASANGRLEAWYFGIQMLMANPIFGIGRGQFAEEHGLVAHNSYIHVAAELGIPGYTLWGGTLIFTLLTGYLFIKARKSNHITSKCNESKPEEISKECQQELLLNKTIFFSLIAFMITGFFISRMFTLLLYIFLGMAIASHVRVIKLIPEYKEYFSVAIAIKSMRYCWVIIVAVYIALKMGL